MAIQFLALLEPLVYPVGGAVGYLNGHVTCMRRTFVKGVIGADLWL